jgi:cell division protein FtsW
MTDQSSKILSVFLTTVLLLIIIGIIFIYSSSSVYALDRLGCAHYFVKKQALGVGIGIVFFCIMQCIPVAFLEKIAIPFFIVMLGVTALTLQAPFGQTIHGSARWLTLGGFSFQPSELLKIAGVMSIARLIAKRKAAASLQSYTYGALFVRSLAIVACAGIVLLKQPDFGQTITLLVTCYCLLFMAALPMRYILLSTIALIPVIVLLIVKKQYRLQRILTYLNPWDDPQGKGFQIIQSLIAIGSGGWCGIGIGQSKQKFFYLPMQHTDFIVAIIAEETGFLGIFFIILLFILFLYTSFVLAWRCSRPFATYTILGLSSLITFQAVINILGTTGLIPTKGIGLPFVSYGLSALVANSIMVGIIVRCSQE